MEIRLFTLILTLLLKSIYSTSVFAKLEVISTAPVVIGSDLVLSSEILEREVPVRLFLPENFAASSDAHTYPVLFIEGSHGQQFFHAVSGMVKHLSNVERMPETIVVAVDGDSPSPDIYHNDMWGKQSEAIWPTWGNPKKYHAFLQQELFPFLKENYRANDSRTAIGISGSSFFPFYSVLSDDSLFDHYIFLATADIIGMGYSAETTIKDELIALFKTKNANVSVLFSVADSDIEKDERYQANLAALKDGITNTMPNQFIAKVYPEEGHYDVLLKTLLDFIEVQYPFKSWSARYRDIVAQEGNALQNLDNHFHSLSEKYGFDILPRATRWNSVNRLEFISRHLLRQGRITEAVEVATRYTEYQPNSWLAFETLANMQIENQDLKSAAVSLEKAITLAKDNETQAQKLQKQLQSLAIQSAAEQ